jgi:polyphosphate:AMP phosphotransferase
MFESADLDHSVPKAAYKREEPKLRAGLLAAQYALMKDGRFAAIVLIAGVQGAGRGETVNLLNEWMDPRHVATYAFGDPTEEERERPEQWRFWRVLPPKGKIGVLFGAWHTGPIMRRVRGETSDDEFAHEASEIARFEQMLTDEGVLLLKYWFHVSAKQQKKRLKKAHEKPDAPYKRFVKVSEAFLRRTSTGEAPWLVVPGGDRRYRALTFGKHLLAALRERLGAKVHRTPHPLRTLPLPKPVDGLNVIRALRLEQPMAKSVYKSVLKKTQANLNALSRHPKFGSIAVVAVFEGNDAAGKGGAITRVTASLDARLYRTISVAAPTEEEAARPYLWRFWRHIPRRGHLTLFDRSWYGRVLVERVEGLASEPDWMRAYSEINDFEQSLVRHRIVVVKFWLAISKEEQLKRFRERETVSFKRFKMTPEDWRNRKKWGAYESAVCDMVDRTSTRIAPWTLVEANNKYYARIKILRTLCDSIEDALEKARA